MTLLCLFLISTSGVVLFYHFCQHAHQTVYSFYIDETEELCAENALIYCDNHASCCQHHHDEHSSSKPCCDHHKSFHKIVKLTNSYTFSEQIKSPKPLSLKLLFEPFTELMALNEISLSNKELYFDYPPEVPKTLRSGRDIVTSYQTLKLDC